MTVRVLSGPPHDCARDGHLVALRARYYSDGPDVEITPFCEVCSLLFLPPDTWIGPHARALMRIVNAAQWAKEAPPEAYEALYGGDA